MSFSTEIKNEVTRLDSTKEELITELSAIVRNSAIIDRDIVIYIENNSVARRIFKLFKNVYDITPIITVRKKIFNIYISNTHYINNWDLVDLSAPNIVGNHLYNGDCSLLYEFAKSNHLWKQRIAVVATLTFIRKGEFTHTYALAKLFMDTRHDLMQKAVGWMLREAGKRDATQLRNFLNEYKNIMPRTMLRYAIEKFSPKERKEFMMR